ncbi:ABC transporter permease [Ferdinandcohnia sp. SAFN-114]|uniref:ABC transporter permease n=1 Tax=Ferdinandcohnia sp. SAFN-114 TaxID=3387275 RepID=UPI003F82282B
MKSTGLILREQFSNIHLIFRLSIYDIKSKYQSHYLGVLWQFLNPAIQVMIYWFVFGIGLRQGRPMGDVPFIAWLLVGLIPWFFIAPTINQGANSVYSKVNLVSKMKFPVSVLPTIVIVGNTFNFFAMLVILFVILFCYDVFAGVYLIQLLYYLLCTFAFLFAFSLLSSTISTIVRDFQMVLQSIVRMMLYLTPILWDMSYLPDRFLMILKLNPVFYLIEGFRNTFLGYGWFYEHPLHTFYFWLVTLTILWGGSVLHLKFRDKFVDYL